MDDEFVKKAFENAQDAEIRDEAHAYCAKVGGDKIVHLIDMVAFRIGLDKMEELCKAIVLNGQEKNFTEFVKCFMMFAFHEGYHAAKQIAE